MGDPAGVGPEIIIKAATSLSQNRRVPPRLLVAGDLAVMTETARRLDAPLTPLAWKSGTPLPLLPAALPVIELSRLPARARRPGRPGVAGGEAAYAYIVAGARMALAGEAAALVTAPISKEWLNRAGHQFPGHSELLAEFARVRDWRMMFAGGKLRLALVTVHMGLAKVAAALSRELVTGTIRMLADHLRQCLGISAPRVAVLGFNPHAGENGLFGREEIAVIAPAIEQARAEGIDAQGPLAPDTAFIRNRGRFNFDAAVAMYHDQGLIALKTLEFDRAVNVTLGLPFVRTSPDHGTAFDIAGRGVAREGSMRSAIEYAARVSAVFARNRGAANGGGDG